MGGKHQRIVAMGLVKRWMPGANDSVGKKGGRGNKREGPGKGVSWKLECFSFPPAVAPCFSGPLTVLPPSPLVSWPSFGNHWQNRFFSVKQVRKLWSVCDVVWGTELRRQGSSLLTSGAVVPSGLFFECHNATCPQTIHVSDSYDTLAHFLYPKLWSLGSLVGKLLLGSYRNVLKQRQNHCKVPLNIDCTITRLLQKSSRQLDIAKGHT